MPRDRKIRDRGMKQREQLERQRDIQRNKRQIIEKEKQKQK